MGDSSDLTNIKIVQPCDYNAKKELGDGSVDANGHGQSMN